MTNSSSSSSSSSRKALLSFSLLLMMSANGVQGQNNHRGHGVRGQRRGISQEERNLFRGKPNTVPLAALLTVKGEDKDNNDKNDKDNGGGGGGGSTIGQGWINGQPPLDAMTLGTVWDFTVPNPNGNGISPTNAKCENREYVDVLIIGGGMAGVSAASTLTATDPNLKYVVVESTDQIGGRMKSTSFGGGVANDPGIAGASLKATAKNARQQFLQTITIEDGANWAYDFGGNPVWEMIQQAGLKVTLNDFGNMHAYYESDGSKISDELLVEREEEFVKAWDEVAGMLDEELWTSDHDSYVDNGVHTLLRSVGGWNPEVNTKLGDLDYTVEWEYWAEYGDEDTSVRYFPPIFNTPFHVNDERGFEHIPQTYFQQNANPASLKLRTRVTQINYNENVSWQNKLYKTMTSTTNEQTGTCTDYYAQRIISTVSPGVIESGDITYNPPLVYKKSPYYMGRFVKVFFQFPTVFWDNDREQIKIVRSGQNKGKCQWFVNLNWEGFYPGSNVLRCELLTDTFNDLLDPITQDLTQETLLSLLEPLRSIYGANTVGEPNDIYYTAVHKNKDWGYGGWANWRTGSTFTDFAQFFGGIDIVPYCQHNGCNKVGEWTMQFSGSGACYDMAEYTHGAFFAGDKAAKNTLRELKYDIPAETSPCDVDWVWLK